MVNGSSRNAAGGQTTKKTRPTEHTHIGTSVSPDRRRGNCCWKDHGRGSGAIEPQYDVESVPMPFRWDTRKLLRPKEGGKKSTCDQFVLPTDQDDARPLRDIGGHSILVAVAPVRDRRKMQPFSERSNGLQGPLAYFLARSRNWTGSVNRSWCRKVSVAAAEQHRPRAGAMPSANDQ
jgi:hypothetical protein